MRYVYWDCTWVICHSATETGLVVGQGGRVEPRGFVPEPDSLTIPFVSWMSIYGE